MSTAPEDNRFAPPLAHVEDVHAPGLQLGGRGARLGAALIDGVINGGAYYGLAALFRPLMPSASFQWRSLALQLVVGVVLFVLIQGYLLATQGQTVGKKLLGLRIVRSNGERASFARLLGLRVLLGWCVAIVPVVGMLYSVVDCLLIFRESRKCLHDNIADTIVIKA